MHAVFWPTKQLRPNLIPFNIEMEVVLKGLISFAPFSYYAIVVWERLKYAFSSALPSCL